MGTPNNTQEIVTDMTNQEYKEVTIKERLTVNWSSVVIVYASKVVKYGWVFGASVSTLAIFTQGLPVTINDWIRVVVMIITGGGVIAGLLGVIAIIVKDFDFPYSQPSEHIRTLPSMAAPQNMQAQPLMMQEGNTWRYGKVKLEPDRLLLLAQAILQGGETKISQRKLAEWGIVPGKDSQEAKQLKNDIMYLGYGTEAGNGELLVTRAFKHYLGDMFPALTPPTPTRITGFNGLDASHHHQTPPGIQE